MLKNALVSFLAAVVGVALLAAAVLYTADRLALLETREKLVQNVCPPEQAGRWVLTTARNDVFLLDSQTGGVDLFVPYGEALTFVPVVRRNFSGDTEEAVIATLQGVAKWWHAREEQGKRDQAGLEAIRSLLGAGRR